MEHNTKVHRNPEICAELMYWRLEDSIYNYLTTSSPTSLHASIPSMLIGTVNTGRIWHYFYREFLSVCVGKCRNGHVYANSYFFFYEHDTAMHMTVNLSKMPHG